MDSKRLTNICIDEIINGPSAIKLGRAPTLDGTTLAFLRIAALTRRMFEEVRLIPQHRQLFLHSANITTVPETKIKEQARKPWSFSSNKENVKTIRNILIEQEGFYPKHNCWAQVFSWVIFFDAEFLKNHTVVYETVWKHQLLRVILCEWLIRRIEHMLINL